MQIFWHDNMSQASPNRNILEPVFKDRKAQGLTLVFQLIVTENTLGDKEHAFTVWRSVWMCLYVNVKFSSKDL